jgi:hypothetical protein
MTPGEDIDFERDWREVISGILSELDARIQSFWD